MTNSPRDNQYRSEGPSAASEGPSAASEVKSESDLDAANLTRRRRSRLTWLPAVVIIAGVTAWGFVRAENATPPPVWQSPNAAPMAEASRQLRDLIGHVADSLSPIIEEEARTVRARHEATGKAGDALEAAVAVDPDMPRINRARHRIYQTQHTSRLSCDDTDTLAARLAACESPAEAEAVWQAEQSVWFNFRRIANVVAGQAQWLFPRHELPIPASCETLKTQVKRVVVPGEE